MTCRWTALGFAGAATQQIALRIETCSDSSELALSFASLIHLLTNAACRARRYGVVLGFCPGGSPANLRYYEYSRLQTTVDAAGKTQLEERPQMRLFHSVRDAVLQREINVLVGGQQISLVQRFTIVCVCRPR